MSDTIKEALSEARHGVPVDCCDWCNLSYPKSIHERFYVIKVMGDYNELKTRKICGDCYDHLKEML